MRSNVYTMNKSSHKSEKSTQDQYEVVCDENIDYGLYDNAWESEESDATSLQEVSADYLDSERSGCEDTVNNAITEVSSDFLSGVRVNVDHSKYRDHDKSHSDTEFKLITGFAYVARYPETAAGMSDNDWNPYGTESDTNMSPRSISHEGSGQHSRFSTMLFNPPLHSTDFNVNTPSTLVRSIPDPDNRLTSINEQTESGTICLLEPDNTINFSSISHASDLVSSLHKPTLASPVKKGDLNKTIRGSDLNTSSAETLIYAQENPAALIILGDEKVDIGRDKMSKKNVPFQDGKDFLERETLQRVHNTLIDGQHLREPCIKRCTKNKSIVDYSLLQQDLQDIQDSLKCPSSPEMKLIMNGHRTVGHSRVKSPMTSDNECDIIPSTTTTPDSQTNKMSWDFAADLGYQQPGDLMGDISLETYATTNSHRRSDEKKSYNSDGDETQTSGSSDRVGDHAAADQVLAEMSQILHPQTNSNTSFKDVDLMLFNFKNQRQQIESRYQQLNNQGLAEKVYRILSNQDPQSQANEILSDVPAEERERTAQFIFNHHIKDFNLSTVSSHLDANSHSLALLDNVRKRLDLSGLSSSDASKLADQSSVNVSTAGQGFRALDGMTKLLSSQMSKALERTFNHSQEMIVPQCIIQCYPLTVDNKQKVRSNGAEISRTSAQPTQAAVTRLNEDRQIESSEEEKQERNRNIGIESRPTPNSNVMTLYTGQNDHNQNSAHSHDESDSSSGRCRKKYRPYRPAGSKEMYYTESDVTSVADSVTTMESTHFGSDDAKGPVLPPSALGSRQDAPNVVGIYGNRVPLHSKEGEILTPIQEKSGLDDRETESNRSYKGDKTSESLKSQGKDHDGLSVTERRSIAGIKHGDGSIRTNDNNINEGGHSDSVEVGTSPNIRNEYSDQRTEESSAHGGTGTRNIARLTHLRPQEKHNIMEQQSSSENTNIRHDTRIQDHGRTGRKDHMPHRSRFDEFHSASRQKGYKLPSDHFRRPTDKFEDSEYSAASRYHKEKFTESLLPRIQDDNGTLQAGQRYNYTQDTGKQFSALDLHSLPMENDFTVRNETLPRFHSDEELQASIRGVQLSSTFHRALSPGLRQAIGSRSPILSHQIEQSLRQPPAERSDQRNVHRGRSPPLTFLAWEKGQAPREYAASLRRSPSPTVRSNDRPWSPFLQPRVVSPSLIPEDLDQPNLNLAESQMMTLLDISPESDETEPDKKPVSRRAQRLTRALVQEKELDIQPNIASLWEQFNANQESSESSVGTSSLEAVTDLLLNPSPHLVAQCLKDRQEQIIQRQDRAEVEREKRRTEQRLERLRIHHSSSEDDAIVGYAELLAQKEAERMKRRAARKKKGKAGSVSAKSEDGIPENVPDSLFSIPEDASFEQSPTKLNVAPKPHKSKVSRQPNIIDPNMEKLRTRISKQKQKIDKQTLKELQKIEKLKKLEELLSAKRKGEISDHTLEMQLDEISSASTPGSDNSQEGWGKHTHSNNTTPLSDDSTTAKDSSTEMHASKTNKGIRIKEMKSTEVGQIDKHRAIKTDKDKISFSSKGGSHGISTGKSGVSCSQSKLLKLVKEGYLTAEEAYRLAVERETNEQMLSRTTNHISSSDESIGSHNNRLHRQYSPYARDDSLSNMKSHYVPKLKFTSSVGGATHAQSWNQHNSGQSLRSISAAADYNDSHTSDPHIGSGHIRPKAVQLIHPNASTRERSTVLSSFNSRSMQDRKNHNSPSGSQALRGSLPVGYEKHTSPVRSSPSRRQHSESPVRTNSSSPKYKGNAKQYRSSNKQTTHSSARYETAYGTENEPPLRNRAPESPGVAWHIPIDQNSLNVPKIRGYQKLPLQEMELVTNTLAKKTAERILKIEDLEPLQNKTQKGYEIWHKNDHPAGIPSELWENIVRNDALASKVNHWEVDPLMDRVQYILNKHSGDSSTEGEKGSFSKKPLSKMSLQEAFLANKQPFVSKCKERQKRISLAVEHRKMQECLRLEREAIFLDQSKMTPANLNAHPYSDNLYQPKRRFLSKQEMKELTMKRYKKLPEVLQKQESDKRREQYQLNRLRVNIFNRKVQRAVYRKKSMRQR